MSTLLDQHIEGLRDLATRLALALADEVTFHGDENSADASLAILAIARTQLGLEEEFDILDHLKERGKK